MKWRQWHLARLTEARNAPEGVARLGVAPPEQLDEDRAEHGDDFDAWLAGEVLAMGGEDQPLTHGAIGVNALCREIIG